MRHDDAIGKRNAFIGKGFGQVDKSRALVQPRYQSYFKYDFTDGLSTYRYNRGLSVRDNRVLRRIISLGSRRGIL